MLSCLLEVYDKGIIVEKGDNRVANFAPGLEPLTVVFCFGRFISDKEEPCAVDAAYIEVHGH